MRHEVSYQRLPLEGDHRLYLLNMAYSKARKDAWRATNTVLQTQSVEEESTGGSLVNRRTGRC